MESYLRYTLGLPVDIKAWTDTDTLPDELREEREYYLLEMCGITCLVITMLASDFQMSVFMKQKQQIQTHCELPIVICFDRTTVGNGHCPFRKLPEQKSTRTASETVLFFVAHKDSVFFVE